MNPLRDDMNKHFFNLLEVGERFQFLGNPEICEKISKRKYKDSKGVEHLVVSVYCGIEYDRVI